jgi:hypothetical protein
MVAEPLVIDATLPRELKAVLMALPLGSAIRARRYVAPIRL